MLKNNPGLRRVL
jgi:hypothetical protein